MFKVKNIKSGEITQVLSVYCDEYGKSWFLIWDNNHWHWLSANKFCPPNYTPKESLVAQK